MYDDFFKNTQVSVDRFVSPVRQFQAVLVDNAEKLAHFHFEAARQYAEIGLRNMRDGLSVRDAGEFQNYVSAQQDVFKGVVEKVQNDTQTMVSLQQEFGQRIQKLLEENFQDISRQAESAAKSPRSNGSAARKTA
jgi:phasin family protein